MFGENVEVPHEVGVGCCAQFAVSREQVLMRNKVDYERYRQWLMETPARDATSGRVFEYMWHIVFGKAAV